MLPAVQRRTAEIALRRLLVPPFGHRKLIAGEMAAVVVLAAVVVIPLAAPRDSALPGGGTPNTRQSPFGRWCLHCWRPWHYAFAAVRHRMDRMMLKAGYRAADMIVQECFYEGPDRGDGSSVAGRPARRYSYTRETDNRAPPNIASVCGQPVYDCTQVRSYNRRQWRGSSRTCSTSATFTTGLSTDRTCHAACEHHNGATIRSRPVVSEFGLQKSTNGKGPTRLRYRVVEHIVLAHELVRQPRPPGSVRGPSLRTRCRLRRRPAPGVWWISPLRRLALCRNLVGERLSATCEVLIRGLLAWATDPN